MSPRFRQSIAISERLATAFVSAIAAAITLFVAPLFFSMVGYSYEPLALYTLVFSKTGIVIISVASVIGFSVGSERMANILSLCWVTHPAWKEEWLQLIALGFLIIFTAGVVGYYVFTG
jgi:hypothetical protein